MAGETKEQAEAQVEQTPSDPWAVAFAALGKQDTPATEEAPDSDGGDGHAGDLSDTQGADQGEGAAQDEMADGAGSETMPGGPGDLGGADGGADADADDGDLGITEEEIGQYRQNFEADIRQRAINDVAAAYIKQGARNQNGKLGASINDPDVCKRDRDGVPRFYNPETGREFTGDNPRRQAQEWVDDYNRELRDAFNKTCQEYEAQLMQREGGQLKVIEFAPKYQKLDPMRRMLLDTLLEDYEVTDENGDVIAYSCDLDKALGAVNRQISKIQERYGQQATKPAPPTGPVLDTPSTTTGQAGNAKPEFKSLAEAMEWEQNRLLEESRNRRNKR